MSDISNADKIRLEELFGMKSGYVLDFSNASFKSFFNSYDIDIFDETKYGPIEVSKANRLRQFWSIEDNETVATAMRDMLEKWRIKAVQELAASDPLSSVFSITVQSLEKLKQSKEKTFEAKIDISSAISSFDSVTLNYLIEHTLKLENRLNDQDYSGVITSSRTVVEQLFRKILEETTNGYDEKWNGDINSMYKEVARRLAITKEHTSEPLAKLARGINSIIDGLAQLRNAASDSHGVSYRPARRHAVLAMNSALTIVSYFSELCTDNNLIKK